MGCLGKIANQDLDRNEECIFAFQDYKVCICTDTHQLGVVKEPTWLHPVPNSVCSFSSSFLPILLQALVLNQPSSHPSRSPSVLQCDVTIRELMLHILRAPHPCFFLIHTRSTNEIWKRKLTHMCTACMESILQLCLSSVLSACEASAFYRM